MNITVCVSDLMVRTELDFRDVVSICSIKEEIEKKFCDIILKYVLKKKMKKDCPLSLLTAGKFVLVYSAHPYVLSVSFEYITLIRKCIKMYMKCIFWKMIYRNNVGMTFEGVGRSTKNREGHLWRTCILGYLQFHEIV